MPKTGLGIFTGRRKSSSNVLDELDVNTAAASPDGFHSTNADSGGFRLMSRNEVEKANERRKTMEKEKSSKFPRFSGFGSAGPKGRNQSFEEDSPGSSKRDSKSSNGTQFSSSRYYNTAHHGSTSTLPSSTDTSSDDNLFSNVHRPSPQSHSTPNHSHGMDAAKKQLPSLPKSSSSGGSFRDGGKGRERAATSSSYASTAIAPKLDADLSFGESSFENMFSDLKRNEVPVPTVTRESAGRSLLSEKRTFQAEPIRIHPKLDVEAPLKSWDSRGSAENLMSPQRSDTDSPPPPPPPHKYSSYAPVASESPTQSSPTSFLDTHAPVNRQSYMDQKPPRQSSPLHQLTPAEPSPAPSESIRTPLSSRSGPKDSSDATPKAPLPPKPTVQHQDEEENMFATAKPALRAEKSPIRLPVLPVVSESKPITLPSAPGKKVMTQAEFKELQRRQASQPSPDDSSEDEEYEDEEDAIRKREEEEILRRKNQQMHFAREAMRRSTTAPVGGIGNPNRPESMAEGLSMGFPSETSMKADEWEDEDVPLGILAQHGFPSTSRNRPPNQPANPIPSYFPDRPASAGAMGARGSQAHLPAFARNLPSDITPFIGGGLVRPMNRESMGFNAFSHGAPSVAGESIAGGMGMGMHTPPPMMYQEAGMSQPSLVDQIQMRDMTKQKYMGGASNKKPQGGPFTGMFGNQMNSNGQSQNPTRMGQPSLMNGMNGMNGMNPMMGHQMNPMMGGQMPMMGMGMGMNQMSFPNDYNMQMQQMQQMQQMIAMQQMQLQQMQAMQSQQQYPRMSMAMSTTGYPTNSMPNTASNGLPSPSFLGVPGMPMPPQNRPMSYMSSHQNAPYGAGRAMSFAGPPTLPAGYTPSIAPSERSNIGLSARYRPVVNNSDAHSTGTSMTLQASAGGVQGGKTGAIKGILKKSHTPPPALGGDEADEDWGRLAARKKRGGAGAGSGAAGLNANSKSNDGLAELARGLNL